MSQDLIIALLQMTSVEGIDANVEQILQALEKLPKTHIDLICLPENALFFRISKGTSMAQMELSSGHFVRLQNFVDQSKWPFMIGSVPLKEGSSLYNATVFLEPGQAPQVLYRKLHLFDVDVPGAPPARESDVFQHGPAPVLWQWRGWKIGLSICYDLRFSELYRHYARAGAELILIPSSFLVPTGQAHWEVLVRARAIESQCFIAAAAQSGEHVSGTGEKRYTYGHSLVVNPWGEVVMELTDASRVGQIKLEKRLIETVRRQIPMRDHRQLRKWEDER